MGSSTSGSLELDQAKVRQPRKDQGAPVRGEVRQHRGRAEHPLRQQVKYGSGSVPRQASSLSSGAASGSPRRASRSRESWKTWRTTSRPSGSPGGGARRAGRGGEKHPHRRLVAAEVLDPAAAFKHLAGGVLRPYVLGRGVKRERQAAQLVRQVAPARGCPPGGKLRPHGRAVTAFQRAYLVHRAPGAPVAALASRVVTITVPLPRQAAGASRGAGHLAVGLGQLVRLVRVVEHEQPGISALLRPFPEGRPGCRRARPARSGLPVCRAGRPPRHPHPVLIADLVPSCTRGARPRALPGSSPRRQGPQAREPGARALG